MLIHKVIEGPTPVDEENDIYALDVYAEYEGNFGTFEVVCTFNHAYEICKHMKKPTLEPFDLEDYLQKCTLQ